MRADLALDALEMAVRTRRPKPGVLHLSDRGSQYTSKLYQQAVEDGGFVCSMSRKGERWDNACAESFFGRLKEELGHNLWKTKQGAVDEVAAYVTDFYNTRRVQKRLGFVSPVRYELQRAASQRAA
jgi:putative transposase